MNGYKRRQKVLVGLVGEIWSPYMSLRLCLESTQAADGMLSSYETCFAVGNS